MIPTHAEPLGNFLGRHKEMFGFPPFDRALGRGGDRAHDSVEELRDSDTVPALPGCQRTAYRIVQKIAAFKGQT